MSLGYWRGAETATLYRMAAIDALLRIIASQNADGITLASGEVPRIAKAGAHKPLSMPPVGAQMMEEFVDEVASAAQKNEAARAGAITLDYGELSATLRFRPGLGGWELAFKKRPPARRPPAKPVEIAAPTAVAPLMPMPPVTSPEPPRQERAHEVGYDEAAAQLDRWLSRALDEKASDLFVSAGRGARMRIANELIALAGAPLTSEQLRAVLGAIDPVHAEALARHGSADIAWVWHGPAGQQARFRINLFRQTGGLAAAFRPIRREPPTLTELAMPRELDKLIGYPHGLVLVTGPTGSGKSTTLVALIEQLNRTGARHILTLEDPIEYEYTSNCALIHQRELGTHVDSFDTGLRAALREAPDVILLGEMRDRATIAAALTAAETGHLVLSTLHASSAAMAIDRIIDAFSEHQQRQVRAQLAGCLRAVLTQQLLPSTTPGVRMPVVELMVATPATASLVREGKTHQLASAIQTGRDDGMIPLDRSLVERIDARQITLETALTITLDGGLQLRELLAGRRLRS